MQKQFYVYMMTNLSKRSLYIGMTSNLKRRVYEHKNGFVEGFTKKYKTHYLVYYEICDDSQQAALRERQMKAWKRDWKEEKINEMNPNWDDLYRTL